MPVYVKNQRAAEALNDRRQGQSLDYPMTDGALRSMVTAQEPRLPMTSPNAPPPFALTALSGCYFTLAVGSLSVVGLLDPMSEGLGVSKSQIAYLVTAFALTYAVMAPVLQILVGDWDRKRLLLLGLGAIGLGSLITAVAPGYGLGAVGRIVMAIGAAVAGPMASAAGAALVQPEQRGAALGKVFAGMTLATVLGVPLTAFAGSVIGWRATLVLIAGLAGVVALAVAVKVPPGGRGERSNPTVVLHTLIDPVLAPAISVTFFQMAAQFATYAVIAAYLADRFAIGEAILPFALFTFGIGGILGNWIATRLGDSLGPSRLIKISLGMTAVVFLGLQMSPDHPALAFIALGAWSVAGMLLFAPQQARLISLQPDRANLLLALNGSAIYLGMAGGAALSGILYASSGSEWLALVSAVLVMLALASGLLSERALKGQRTSE